MTTDGLCTTKPEVTAVDMRTARQTNSYFFRLLFWVSRLVLGVFLACLFDQISKAESETLQGVAKGEQFSLKTCFVTCDTKVIDL